MTAKADETQRGNGKCGYVRARLLRNEGQASCKKPQATRDAGCALIQSPPNARRAAETSPGTAAALALGKSGMPPAGNIYEPGTRITCIDRAVILTYFHRPDAGVSARRKKNEGYAKRMAGQLNRDAGHLPADLERRLTPLPKGYSRMLRGSAVILVEEGTHRVIDAVRGVAVRGA